MEDWNTSQFQLDCHFDRKSLWDVSVVALCYSCLALGTLGATVANFLADSEATAPELGRYKRGLQRRQVMRVAPMGAELGQRGGAARVSRYTLLDHFSAACKD